MPNTTIQKTQTKTGNFPSNSTRPNQKNTPSTSRSKGKSRYAQKARGKKFVKPVAAKPSGPVKSYTSVCCSLPATKPRACSAISGSKDKGGLGHWRCSGCHKACKVTVSKAKPTEYPKESLKVLEGIPVPQRPEAFVPEVAVVS